MSLISINGVKLPTPSGYNVGIQDLSKAERNVKGNMLIERIATKRKIDLSYKSISQQELSKVLKLVSPVYFEVDYIDPEEGAIKSGTFYSGDRKCGAMGIKDSVVTWKDVKFSIVER